MRHTVADLARELGATLLGDGSVILADIAGLDEAGPSDLSFVDTPKRLPAALRSRAGCLIVPLGVAVAGRAALAVPDPKRCFARAIALFRPRVRPAPGIHETAVVDPSATLGARVHVGPHVSVAAHAHLGDDVVLGPGSVVGESVRIGAGSTLVARVVVYPGTTIGERALVHAGAVLGSDGFGFVRGPGGLEKFPQVGTLAIGDDVEIGANCTIDRGALGATQIGDGTKIDNLVHVAHNVAVGCRVALSAQVGIAGSSVIEDDVTLAGQVGVADHVRIMATAVLGAQAGVPSHKVVRRGQILWGTPARPLHEFKRLHAHLSQLPALRERIRALESALGSPLHAGDDGDPEEP